MSAEVGDHAFLSDCQTAALVDRDGSVVWWPGESFDGPSVFSKLLDADAGHFAVRPVGRLTTRRRYLPGTLVLETVHSTRDAALVVRDCLALEFGARGHEIGLRSPHVLLRSAEARGGDVEVDVELVPRLEYGLAIPRLVRENGLIVSLGGPERLFLSGGAALEVSGSRAHGRLGLRAGETLALALALHRSPGVTAATPPIVDAEAAPAGTIASWES